MHINGVCGIILTEKFNSIDVMDIDKSLRQ